MVTFSNVVPADKWRGAEYDYNWDLTNTGSTGGTVSIQITNIVSKDANGNVVSVGLGDQMDVMFQRNKAPWGTVVDIYPLSSALGQTYTSALLHLDAGETVNTYLRSWLINRLDNNLVQGGSVTFDVVFILNQDQ